MAQGYFIKIESILNLGALGLGRMQNILLKIFMGLLACVLGLVAEGEFINFFGLVYL
jgi:hypothetical protein